MKKFVVLLMLLICVFVSVPIRVDAKTISDYRNDLAALKKKKSQRCSGIFQESMWFA